MRQFVVSNLIRLAQWITPVQEVSDQLKGVRGSLTMDEIMLTRNWS